MKIDFNSMYGEIPHDNINPTHYLKYAITPTTYIIENKLDFLEGNVIKYVTRHKDKNKQEDLRKAIRYLEIMIENYDKIYNKNDNKN